MHYGERHPPLLARFSCDFGRSGDENNVMTKVLSFCGGWKLGKETRTRALIYRLVSAYGQTSVHSAARLDRSRYLSSEPIEAVAMITLFVWSRLSVL